jgi:adenylate cyclase
MLKKFKQLLWEWRGVLITTPTVATLVLALRLSGFLQLLEWVTYDRFFRWRPAEPLDSRIVIVTIDELDIRKLRQWPLSDAQMAQLLQKIQQQQPRAIGLDIYRDFPVPPGHEELVKVFKSTPNLIGIQKVLGKAEGMDVPPPPALPPEQVGAVDMLLDEDGKVRRALLSVTVEEGQPIYSLAVNVALLYLKAEGITLQPLDPKTGKVSLGKAVLVPMQPNDGGYVGVDTGGYQILLNFRSPRCQKTFKGCELFKRVSITDVLEGRISSDLMRDRIVLIGSTAASLKDVFFTPYSNHYLTAQYGVELHAQIASQLVNAALNGRPLIKVWPEPLEGLWVFLWSGVGAISGWTLLRIPWKAASIFLFSCTLTGVSYLAFLGSWWIPIVPPLFALAGSGVAITAYIAYVERKDRQTVMNLLGQHVTPKIAQAVWTSRHQLLKEGQLLGQKLTATVLFTDIKGFTSITEQTEPETLMVWLNEYMKAMSQSVLDHDGVVDKFIGDAVMAVFGVPIPSTRPEEVAKDAIAAVSCALEMGAKLQKLNQQWQITGRPTVAMRVGIATGTVVAGSLGSHQRLNYTTIGDSVNVAARLESYDKSLEGGVCRILIAEETYQLIQDKFPTRLIGSVQLKGRKQLLNVYQVLS